MKDLCENCGQAIGKLEEAFVWQNNAVCKSCYERLNSTQPNSSRKYILISGAAIAFAGIVGLCAWLVMRSPSDAIKTSPPVTSAMDSSSTTVVSIQFHRDRVDARRASEIRDVSRSDVSAVLDHVSLVADDRFGWVAAFDGHQSGVSLGTKRDFQLTDALSLSAFFRFDAAASTGPILGMDDWQGAGQAKGYVLRLFEGKMDFTLGIENSWVSVGTPGALEPSVWHHVVGTYNGKEMRLFIDGKNVAAKPVQGRIGISNFPLSVGVGAFDTERRFTGNIAQIMLFREAISPETVVKISRIR